jgi:hypothetical protein
MSALRKLDPRAADRIAADSGEAMRRAWATPKKMAADLGRTPRRARQIIADGCGSLSRVLEITRAADRPEAIVAAVLAAAHYGRLEGMTLHALTKAHDAARAELIDAHGEWLKAVTTNAGPAAEARAARRATEASAKVEALAQRITEQRS